VAFCINCGNQVTPNMKFCKICGGSITPDVATTQPLQQIPTTQPIEVKHVSRTPELVLGLIGGVIGLLFVPVMLFLGAFQEVFVGETTLYAQTTVAALMSIVGLVGAVFVKSKPKASGIMLVFSGIIGIITALGFYVGGLLLLIAGILALVRKDK